MIIEQTSESGEKLSEIERLTLRAQEVGESVALWNRWYMIFVAATVVLAAGVFITQFVLSRRNTELANMQGEIIREKDRIAEADSQAKDGNIAVVSKQAADSNAVAAGANERAGKAEERAAQAQASLALAEQHSAEANAKAEGFRLDIANANESAERERLARIKLEQQIAPRSLTDSEMKELSGKMEGLGVQRADFLLYPNDGEILGFAKQIGECLKGWTFNTQFSLAGNNAVTGVLIEYDPNNKAAMAQAKEIVLILHSFGFKVEGPNPSLPIPANRLPAYMGEKPTAPFRFTVGKK